MSSPDTDPPQFYSPGTFRPENSIAHLMRRVIGSLRAQVNTQLVAHDLTFVQWLPLYKIGRHEGHTVVSLARELESDPGAVTRVIDRLQAKGLVTRERSTQDRRVTHLALTDAGRDIAAQAAAVLAEVLNHHLRGFSHSEWQLLEQLLTRMLTNGDDPCPPSPVWAATPHRAEPLL